MTVPVPSVPSRPHRCDPVAARSAIHALGAAILAVLLAGCAGSQPAADGRAGPPASSALQLSPACPLDRALLVPRPTPDCSFARVPASIVDPDRWTVLRLAFERRCFENAERITRERLRRLQKVASCSIDVSMR